MNLQKAKEILNHEAGLAYQAKEYDLSDAIKLGAEALEFLKARRTIYTALNIMKLPGETKD